MIGYGGGTFAWGLNTVTESNVSVTVKGYPYDTIDFQTAYGTTTDGSYSATNNAVLIGGDSGGGDFIYDPGSGTWELAGINEAVDTSNNNSYMVEVSAYASQINSIIEVPEPGCITLAGAAVAVFLACRRKG